MRIVLDANVWLSGLFWGGEARKIILLAEQKKFILLTSKEIISEITNVLQKEAKFTRFLKDREKNIEDVARTTLFISELIEVKSKIDFIKDDPSDNKILEAALDGRAKYIVSYDNHLLRLREFQGIKIIIPQEFLKIIEKN